MNIKKVKINNKELLIEPDKIEIDYSRTDHALCGFCYGICTEYKLAKIETIDKKISFATICNDCENKLIPK